MIFDFDLNRFFNDFDLTSLLKIKILILELQELIVVISLYSCRSLRLSWLAWLPVSMVNNNANLLTYEYAM